MVCLKCGHKMETPDTKTYKSYEDIPEAVKKEYIAYVHRWHVCPNCGSTGQSAAHWIPGSFKEAPDYEPLKANLGYFKDDEPDLFTKPKK